MRAIQYFWSDTNERALNQLVFRPVLHSFSDGESHPPSEVGYTERMAPGSTDVIGSAETNVTVTVNNQSVNRQDNYWYKRLTVDNIATSAYEELNIVGVYSPGGTNEDIVSSVTGSVFVAETPEQFTYDDDGNLLTDGRFSYAWDGENRLVSMETLPGLPIDVPVVHVAFDYDYMSRRIGKTVYEWDDGTTNWLLAAETTFLYDSWNLVREQTHKQTNTQTNFFTWGLDLSGSLQGAGGIGGLLASYTSATSNSVGLYTYDANGNVSELLDTDTGLILAHYEYSPFGKTIVATGDLAKENPYRFSTKYTDDETKLVYYGYRFYSPDLGRWLSRDPIEELGGINLYTFINNNSVCSLDMLGLNLFRRIKDAYAKIKAAIALCKSLPKQVKSPIDECPAIEGAYRHCWNNCVAVRCSAWTPGAIAFVQGFGIYAEITNWYRDSWSDFLSNMLGIMSSFNIVSCEKSCTKTTQVMVNLKCCSENSSFDKTDSRCCQ